MISYWYKKTYQWFLGGLYTKHDAMYIHQSAESDIKEKSLELLWYWTSIESTVMTILLYLVNDISVIKYPI